MLQRSKFYWRRLRGERVTKSLGIGAVVFALVLQSFAVLQPSTAQAAVSDPNDNIVYQGAANKAALLAVYDSGRDSAGHTDIKQIYSHIGITRDDLANASEGTYYTDDFNGQIKTLGRMDWKQTNRQALTITGASTSVYTGGFLDGYNAKHYPMRALIGKRAVDGQWFAITLDCGNVVYTTLPPAPVKNINESRPGTGVITIKETDRLSTDVATDSEACKPKPVTPVDNKITVCRPGTGVITIKESQRLSTDLPAADAACQPNPVTVAPVVTQLPRTGKGETLVVALGLSLLAAASYFYWDSRRLLGAARL
jgi:LPXTG-motif cell wall-anchored protein